MKYIIINLEDIPDKLPHGKQYNTRVVNAYFKDGDFVVELEFLGTEYNPDNPQCLLPLSSTED